MAKMFLITSRQGEVGQSEDQVEVTGEVTSASQRWAFSGHGTGVI